ncbi:hypothetical protein MJG53_013763 [Ovis ammon polii x Ovis aries]|uniref:Uncharacterized protein n=1 Tax=Ovis ammon polii x Ovis aries TaxID=2918886 RepID=A0ACB9UKG5_9CETA|nr:hypothetical protein MJG53_013763 [Ovis ammon polii x Ovis aries]
MPFSPRLTSETQKRYSRFRSHAIPGRIPGHIYDRHNCCARCYEEGNSPEGVSLVKPAPHTAVIADGQGGDHGSEKALSIRWKDGQEPQGLEKLAVPWESSGAHCGLGPSLSGMLCQWLKQPGIAGFHVSTFPKFTPKVLESNGTQTSHQQVGMELRGHLNNLLASKPLKLKKHECVFPFKNLLQGQTVQEEWNNCGSPDASLAKYLAMMLAPSQSPGALAHLNILASSPGGMSPGACGAGHGQAAVVGLSPRSHVQNLVGLVLVDTDGIECNKKQRARVRTEENSGELRVGKDRFTNIMKRREEEKRSESRQKQTENMNTVTMEKIIASQSPLQLNVGPEDAFCLGEMDRSSGLSANLSFHRTDSEMQTEYFKLKILFREI